VLIAQAVFLLEREQTDTTERPTHAGGHVDWHSRVNSITAGAHVVLFDDELLTNLSGKLDVCRPLYEKV